jgi:putative oxidoreductase
MDSALLLVRLVVGLYVAAHGAQKLFGWFGGPGLAGTRGFLGGLLGFRPAAFWSLVVALAEFAGGLLLALGLLGPIGPIAVATTMLTTIVVVHWSKGPWNSNGGYELPLTYLAVALGVALAGPGAFSLDHALGIALPTTVGELVAALGLIGVVLAIATRQTPAAQPQPHAKAA